MTQTGRAYIIEKGRIPFQGTIEELEKNNEIQEKVPDDLDVPAPTGHGSKGRKRRPMKSLGKFDYVIVGAGSAGCVLANRLSEDPESRTRYAR